jgi:hypothetical protein
MWAKNVQKGTMSSTSYLNVLMEPADGAVCRKSVEGCRAKLSHRFMS